MNFLAHSYLTFADEHIVGQFLEDFIRNRDRFSYPEKMVQGIMLHREIDTFTDAHPEISEAKKIFAPVVRLYAGAFVDVAFDYFLANSLPAPTLAAHAERVYEVLNKHYEFLPENLSFMLQRMEAENWLYHYRDESGIRFSMLNVLRKAKYLNPDMPVFEAFIKNKEKLSHHFDRFFPDLQQHCLEFNRRF